MKRCLTLLVLWLLPALAAAQQPLDTAANVSALDAGTACSVSGSCAVFTVGGAVSVTLEVAGTFSATLTVEGSGSGGSFSSVLVQNMATGAQSTTITATGNYAVVNPGFKILRARATGFSLGTAIVTAARGFGATRVSPNGFTCSTLTGNCSCVAYSDAAVQNQWNVMSCTLPAGRLAATGDAIDVVIDAKMAASGDTKAFQLYLNGGTCSGTGATCCSSGTQIYSDGSTGNGAAFVSRHRIHKTAASTQNVGGFVLAATSVLGADAVTGSVTDTAAIPIVFCARDTTAAAATLQGTPTLELAYTPAR